jgi:chromosome segregation ATPase
MINLEQIQKLEARVTRAVELIKTLKTENQNLKKTLDSAQKRMQELENLVADFKNDQKDIESCILRALDNLNELEDEVKEPPADDEETEDNLPFRASEADGTSGKTEELAPGDGSGELGIF